MMNDYFDARDYKVSKTQFWIPKLTELILVHSNSTVFWLYMLLYLDLEH